MRYFPYRKSTVEESCNLSVSSLKRRGMLSGEVTDTICWTHSLTSKTTLVLLTVDVERLSARLTYFRTDSRGTQVECDYEVALLTSPCNFGGIRYWFACPTCSERVACLYLAPRERYFMCRHCADLTYRSRTCCVIESMGRTSRQIEKLRGQIKRWTWRGRPTRKVRKLQSLQYRENVLSHQALKQLGRLRNRIG